MNLLTKIKLFALNLLNSWPVQRPEEFGSACYLTVSSPGGPSIEIDFNFNIESAPMLANLLYQLDSSALTGTIVDFINQRCMEEDKEDEFHAFMAALHEITVMTVELTDVQESEPVIKPSQVFKYTVEQPKLN